MRILITGGTGFIGSQLAMKCIDRGYSVKIFAKINNDAEENNKKAIEKKGANFISGSITDRELIFDLVKDVDVVYHLAAAQHEANVPDKVFWDVNVVGTKNVLDASVAANVERFVHGSTIGVFGNMDGMIDEHSPCHPDNIYGVTKLEGEKLVLSYSEKLPIVVVRIPETYGPGDRRLLKLFKVIKKNMFFMIGSGQNLHHLIYIDDLIDGFFLVTEKSNSLGNFFIFAGNEPVTTNDMVKIIANEVGAGGAKLKVPLLPFLIIATILETILNPLGIQPPLHRRRMDFFKKNFSFSTKKANKSLNFAAKIDFKEGVSKTVNWYEKNGYL